MDSEAFNHQLPPDSEDQAYSKDFNILIQQEVV